MKWPWTRVGEAKAQTEQAKAVYEQAIRNRYQVKQVLAALEYHAEQNRIVESIQKVARGH